MAGCSFTLFAKIEICTNCTFVSDTFHVGLSTLITSDVIVDNSWLLGGFTLDGRLSQEGVLDLFHELRHHFSEFVLNVSLSNLTDLRLVQDWVVFFNLRFILFLDNLGLAVPFGNWHQANFGVSG